MTDRTGLKVEIAQSVPIPLDVSFTCGIDEVLAVFGPSGSGKTTLLRGIAGLRPLQDARIECDGEIWTDTAADRHTPTHRRRVGMVFQHYALFPHLTALDNIAASLRDRPASERRATAARWLAAVHMAGLESRRPAALSGGQQQRVALARALARDPRVLLLDEPFAAIDRPTRITLQHELDDLRRRLRIPVVVVTHDFEDVIRLATHVLVLDRGKAVDGGPIEKLTSRPDLPWGRYGVGAGSVFDARVDSVDPGRGLARLTSPAGALIVPRTGLEAGDRVRVRVPAREIILATAPPEGVSLHNVLPAEVVETGPRADQVLVQLRIGDLRLLAEITRDAVDRLNVRAGRKLFALIKSVSMEIHV